mmetsp:Transcript_3481/g.21870  ORF Transcript_3481/g.21870 Transcript_3481/m.21870 type:complete len:354 (-) Transcript_3481:2741-3802(-)
MYFDGAKMKCKQWWSSVVQVTKWTWMPEWLMILAGVLYLAAGIAYTIATVQASSETRNVLETLGVNNTAGMESIVDDMKIVASCFLAGSTLVLLANLVCSGLVSGFLRQYSLPKANKTLVPTNAPAEVEETDKKFCSVFCMRADWQPTTCLPVTLEFVMAIILILVVLLSALTAAWIVGVSVVKVGAKSALQFWEYGKSLLLDDLSSFEELYEEILASSVDTITMEDWEDLASRYNMSEALQTRLSKELSVPADFMNGTSADVCPTNLCIDLSLYEFLDSDKCLCNPAEIRMVRKFSDSAFSHLVIALLSTFVLSLGGVGIMASLHGNYVGLYLTGRLGKALHTKKRVDTDSA